ncbi:cytochrome P450 [Nocardia sp. CA-120079]|uniref:cytochrome P450 n=1 Tax=Nocardia sp. CA-120079 TaxID=3239974 RepID=UPI003D99972E
MSLEPNIAADFDPLNPDLAEGNAVDGERFWPVVAEFQQKCPVARAETHGGFYYLTKYDDIRRAATDWKTFSSSLRGGSAVQFGLQEPLLPLDADPPLQREMRTLMAPHFTPAAAQRSADRIREIVNQTIDNFAEPDRCEFVEEFSNTVAPLVVFECVFGLPTEEIEYIAPIAHQFPAAPEKAAAVMPAFQEWCHKVLAERRNQPPRGDLMDVIVHGKPDGQHPLTDSQQVSTMVVVVGGGLETVALAFSNMARLMATRPELRAELEAPDADLGRAIEEFLRYEAPAPHMGRAARNDVTIREVDIPAGERVVLGYGAAGRDPEMFEKPDELCLTRSNANKHLAFGAGAHVCPGSHLARVELRVGLEEMLRRLPKFSIDPASEVEYRTSLSRGVQVLPLVFEKPIPGHPKALR